jgi:hypothetical protein
MLLLRAGQVNRRGAQRPGRRIYNDAAREALIVVWGASDRIWGKRLASARADPRRGNGAALPSQLAPEVRARLPAMSATTIDRADIRREVGTATRRLSCREESKPRCGQGIAGFSTPLRQPHALGSAGRSKSAILALRSAKIWRTSGQSHFKRQ